MLKTKRLFHVSIHAPARGATGLIGDHAQRFSVSIHAPARGAISHWRPRSRFSVSIHAPARGAIIRPRSSPCVSACFNPRPCARGDTVSRTETCFGLSVSIHAPARGATSKEVARCQGQKVSIHAPARGATTAPRQIVHSQRFQSTPLREGRFKRMLNYQHRTRFNPRPCARGDRGGLHVGAN